MDWIKILPMAIVMIAGPQVLSTIFLATSKEWRRNSVAFVGGAAVSLTAVVTLAYFLAGGKTRSGSSSDTLDIVFLVLLALAAIWVFATRKTSEPPAWMGKLQDASPWFSFKLGFLLLGIVPGDFLAAVAIGSYVSNHGYPWWNLVPFIALTLFILALPAIIVIALGEKGEEFLPKARDWMNDNSWMVSEFVIGFFILIEAGSLFG